MWIVAAVIPGNITASELHDGEMAKTLQGTDVTVHINANGVFFDQSKVLSPDHFASNGVAHVVGSVLLPPGVHIPCLSATRRLR